MNRKGAEVAKPAASAGTTEAAPAPGGDAARSYVRGSGALLAGRLISTAISLVVQVLTVRYLAKVEYGSFAYALGIASIGSSTVLIGLGKSVPRFVPIYNEKGDHARAFGTMALAIGTVAGIGASAVALVWGLKGVLADRLITEPLSLSLLLIIIALAPINALDHLLERIVAVFLGARAIFFRRYVLGPGLKLAAVLAVIAVSGDVFLLAYGYVVGGVIGIALYASMLLKQWRVDGLIEYLRPRRMRFPARELYSFSLPLLSAELPVLVRGSIAIVFLEFFRGAAAVAEYRAVYPVAGLNLVVFQAFGFLFVPLASRMFARGDRAGIDDLFWRSALWITVFTFPVLAITTSLATPLATTMFGREYAGAGTVLAILAVGYFFNAALGYNASTLQVHGRVRYTMWSDLFAAAAFVALCFWLIPRHGALGAAIATTTNIVLHNVSNQIGLRALGTGVRMFNPRAAGVMAIAVGLLVILILVQQMTDVGLLAGGLLAAVASVLLIRLTRRLVDPAESFPELLRIPLVRWVIQ